MKQQQMVYSVNLESGLKKIFDKLKPQQILVIASIRFLQESNLQTFFKKNNVTAYCFTEIEYNPTISSLEKGLQVFKESKPDIILAIGGGSVLDTAKSINVLTNKTIQEIHDCITGAKRDELTKATTMIAVPTTAGSGAEATHFAAIYLKGKKFSLASPDMLPDYVILDPSLTYSLSSRQTALSGIDALCQGVESLWSVRSNEQSKMYAEKAIKLAWNNLEKAVHNPSSEVRAHMLEAAHFSGKAINISQTTASHALSYVLTTEHGVPHGQAVAVTLPALILFNSEVDMKTIADPRGVDHVNSVILQLATLVGVKEVGALAQKFQKFITDTGLVIRLRDLGVKEDEITELASSFSTERAGNNPRYFDKTAAERILRAVY